MLVRVPFPPPSLPDIIPAGVERIAQERNMQHTARHASRSSSKPQRSPRSGRAAATDAISLLKSDHRQVEQWFGQFEKSRSADKKAELAKKICHALKVHTTIEEEIFYPAYLEATADDEMHHEAEVEHEGARNLIAKIEASGPDDEYFDARVTVLSEMIKHHVKEEEKRGGMFSKARSAGMDLEQLGEQLRERKQELDTVAGQRLS
jgi:hemerythrin superfamily protein